MILRGESASYGLSGCRKIRKQQRVWRKIQRACCLALAIAGPGLPLTALAAESPFLNGWRAEGRLNLIRVLDPETADWFYLHPVYRDLYEAGSDVGGDREEFRDQNRARQLSRRGLDAALYSSSWTGGLRLTARSISDYHYYRRNQDRSDTYTQPGEMYAYFRWRPAGTGAGDPTPDSSSLLTSIVSGDEAGSVVAGDKAAAGPPLRLESRPAPGLSLQGGRLILRSDPEGLLYHGESVGGRLVYTGENAGRAEGLRVGIAGMRMDREVRAVGRPDHPAATYFGTLGWLAPRWTLGALYAFYRSPGRAAVSDLYLPGIPPTQVALPVGQSALPDSDVHYYGLRYQHDWGTIEYTLSAYYNAGRQIAVDAGGTRVGSSRRSVRGALAYGELVYRFQSDAGDAGDAGSQGGPGCIAVRPAANSCVRAAALRGGPELALAGLFGSRDGNDGDDKHRGFGALRPVPLVMGGAASIFLSGPPVAGERPPLANAQPGTLFADGGLPDSRTRYPDGLQPDGIGRARDNVDPTPPEYDNEGLSMASLRFSFAPFEASPAESLAFDLFVNYAAFRTGRGWEGIAAARIPFRFVDARFALELSATGATYRSTESTADPLTGALRRPPRKFYSRYRVGFALAL